MPRSPHPKNKAAKPQGKPQAKSQGKPEVKRPPRIQRKKSAPKEIAEKDIPFQVAKGERIAKVMARAGACSRRDAEELILAGRVRVNGEVVMTPATLVHEADDIRIDRGTVLKKQATRVFLLHKPAGFLTTTSDPKNRPIVFDLLPRGVPRLVTVGRLDMNTEGLLILTNDGELKRYLELPSTGLIRRYRARVMGNVTPEKLARLKKGITWRGVSYGPVEAKLERTQEGANAWVSVAIQEGKNREVRNVMEAIGLKVNRLIRVSYGPFQLGKLKRGLMIELRPATIREQLPKDLRLKLGIQ